MLWTATDAGESGGLMAVYSEPCMVSSSRWSRASEEGQVLVFGRYEAFERECFPC